METWVPYSAHISRTSLVFGGTDGNGTPMYIGRGHHQGDLIPGKVLINNNCHVPYNGVEHSMSTFEVLINSNYQWAPSSNGQVPHNAILGGRTSTGEQLYVGRATHCGVMTPGKVHPSHGCIYIPFSWKEHRYTNYEVLVNTNSSGWCPPPIQPPVVCPPVNPPHCGPPGRGRGRGGHHDHHHRHHHH